MALLFETWIMHFVLGPSHFVKWVISGNLFSFSNYMPINEFGTGIAVRAQQTCSFLGTHGLEGGTGIKRPPLQSLCMPNSSPPWDFFNTVTSAVNAFSL